MADKKRIASVAAMAVLFASAFMVMLSPTKAAFAATTTIIGWLAPDSTHWNSGIPVLVLSLAGVALFTMMARFFDLRNVGAFALIGLVAGSIFGMLSLGNSTSGNFVPWGLVIVAVVDLFLYLWKGEG